MNPLTKHQIRNAVLAGSTLKIGASITLNRITATIGRIETTYLITKPLSEELEVEDNHAYSY